MNSGAAHEQLHWLKHGFSFKIKRPPAPTGCGAKWEHHSHVGACQHTDYLVQVWAEYIVLGS